MSHHKVQKKKEIKPKKRKVSAKDTFIEIDRGELSLIIEALEKMRKKVEEDRFYRNDHPREFYDIYLERYWRLIEKLDVKIPKAIFIKMPKF